LRLTFWQQPPLTPSLIRRTITFKVAMNSWSSLGSRHCQQCVNQTQPSFLIDGQGFEHDPLSSDAGSLPPPPLSTFGKPCSDLHRYKSHRRPRSEPSHRTFHMFSKNGQRLLLKVVSLFKGRRSSVTTDHKSPPLPTPEQPSTIQAKNLRIHRCYYFAARNCKGWTIGRSPHDACESCWVSFHHIST
jgi:hypothetical protein